MHQQNLWSPSLLAVAMLAATPASKAQDQVTAEQVVGEMEKTFGVTPGERRNHIKGVCAVGEFVGSPEVAKYSSSPLFSGKPIPVVARFSVAGGNPKAPDTARNPRGMALEFQPPGGKLQHITMINTPMFGAKHPKTFLDQMIAIRPDPATGKPDPEKIKAFKASHPDARAQADFLDKNNPPVSYANSSYFGLHTFKFINDKDKTTLVRWRFVPQDGEKRLTDKQMKTMPPNFLREELIDRTNKAPVKWNMLVKIGQKGDPETDPTVTWPKDRKEINAGTLTITKAVPQKEGACDKINYDPLVMAEGIAPTDDPILLFRSPSYAVSFGKRVQGK